MAWAPLRAGEQEREPASFPRGQGALLRRPLSPPPESFLQFKPRPVLSLSWRRSRNCGQEVSPEVWSFSKQTWAAWRLEVRGGGLGRGGGCPRPRSVPPTAQAGQAQDALGTEPRGTLCRHRGSEARAGAGGPAGWSPGPSQHPRHSEGTVALAAVCRKAEVSSASRPGIWTPATLEYPGVRDALTLAEAPLPWAARLCSLRGWGLRARSQPWAWGRHGHTRDTGIRRCSRAEAAEDDPACTGLSLSV